MAIVNMKKLRILALEEEKTNLLQMLQSQGSVELSTVDQTQEDYASFAQQDDGDVSHWKSELSRTKTALVSLEQMGDVKAGLLQSRRAIGEGDFIVAQEAAIHCEETITAKLQLLASARAEESRLRTRQGALLPWQALDTPLAETGTAQVAHRLCVFPGGTDMAALAQEIDQLPLVLEEVSSDKQQRYCTLLYLKAEEDAVLDTLRPAGISVVTFADYDCTAQKALAQLEKQLQDLTCAQEAATATIVEQAPQVDALRQYVDWLESRLARATAHEQLLSDQCVSYLEGWVEASKLPALEVKLQAMGCAWETSDPVEDEYPNVPVKLKSNWLTKPLNMVTEMYSLPAYHGVDPNPLMAPFFILFYGIMMADMGYGLLMLLGGGYVLKKVRPTGTLEHMAGLMCLCGVSTFLMGALTGGFFGDFLTQLAKLLNPDSTFALPALFTPLEDTLMILIGAMALGLVQIITGMAVSFVYKLRHGQVMDAIWEEVTWWLVFLGGALAFLNVTNLVLYVAGIMILVGAGWNEKGFGKVTAVFGSLYNHITGYFGDILSYSRLMALMLAGSVIAQVFNTLGAIPGNVVIFLVISFAGNTLNFALNLLGCYVHDLRLQCLEYFGKFYMDGGRPFRPLTFHTKYVEIHQDLGGN